MPLTEDPNAIVYYTDKDGRPRSRKITPKEVEHNIGFNKYVAAKEREQFVKKATYYGSGAILGGILAGPIGAGVGVGVVWLTRQIIGRLAFTK